LINNLINYGYRSITYKPV